MCCECVFEGAVSGDYELGVICLAASIRCGRPFLGISLPTKSMQSLLFSLSWCLIFWQFSVGLNFWVSTPLGMTRIFVLSMLYSWVIFLAEYLLTVMMRFAFGIRLRGRRGLFV